MKPHQETVFELADWDKLVSTTYGRPYNFQQQDDCQQRGRFKLTVPDEHDDGEMNDSIPEEVNGPKMGVKFDVWLARDPKQPIPGQTADYQLDLFWSRNFYPHIQAVANDLNKRGLLPDGKYTIDIDW